MYIMRIKPPEDYVLVISIVFYYYIFSNVYPTAPPCRANVVDSLLYYYYIRSNNIRISFKFFFFFFSLQFYYKNNNWFVKRLLSLSLFKHFYEQVVCVYRRYKKRAHFHINKETSSFEGYCWDGFTYTPLLSSLKLSYT